MTRTLATIIIGAAVLAGCGTSRPIEPNRIDVTLPAPTDRVKTAVVQVLKDGGYCDVDWENGQTLATCYRTETINKVGDSWDWTTWSADSNGGFQRLDWPSWDWLYRLFFGTIKSRVEATVTPSGDQATRLQLQVESKAKAGLFTWWGGTESELPQSAQNQLRLIKNALATL